MEKSRAEITQETAMCQWHSAQGEILKTPFDCMLLGKNGSHYKNSMKSWKNNEHYKLDLNLTSFVASNSVSL